MDYNRATLLEGRRWLVEDEGSPPKLGAHVTVAGRTAEVVASNNELINSTEDVAGRFIVVFLL